MKKQQLTVMLDEETYATLQAYATIHPVYQGNIAAATREAIHLLLAATKQERGET